MKYSINWLQDQIQQGIHVEYLFFWGHTQKQEGVIDKFCLSQWFPAAFTEGKIIYPTAEHWMMAKKALLFKDQEQYKQILSTPSPAKAKKCGRAVKNFDAEIWNKNSYDFVVQGNIHKFSQNKKLQDFLVNTGNAIIVEASPFDKIWGIGSKTHESDPFKWRGNNLLGFALMEVRDILNENK